MQKKDEIFYGYVNIAELPSKKKKKKTYLATYIVSTAGVIFFVHSKEDMCAELQEGDLVQFTSPPQTGKKRWAKNIKILDRANDFSDILPELSSVYT